MWNISAQSFGFVLTFSGKPSAQELAAWIDESKRRLLQPLPEPWGLVVDMREMQRLDADAQAVVSEGRKAYEQHGMKRMAVVLGSPDAVVKVRRLCRSPGTGAVERFIDATTTPEWKSAAKQWVVSGVEPPR